MTNMLRNRRSRRYIAILLVVLGGALMYLAPEGWLGLVLLILGVVVEVAGITLERKVK
jgi:drug/metabolite transporter (DMT)-like permease